MDTLEISGICGMTFSKFVDKKIRNSSRQRNDNKKYNDWSTLYGDFTLSGATDLSQLS